MKIKTKSVIEEISHSELVDVLSTMLYGNNVFSVAYNKNSKSIRPSDTCLEEKLASVLLGGESIIFVDTYAESEDEAYGDLECEYNEGFGMGYSITLTIFKDGLAKCLDSEKKYIRESASRLVENDGSADLNDGDNVLQMIVFDDIIYG